MDVQLRELITEWVGHLPSGERLCREERVHQP
jgi:hypothetical protein